MFSTLKCPRRQISWGGKPHFISLQSSRRSQICFPSEWIINVRGVPNILPSFIVLFPLSGHRESSTRFLGQTRIGFGPISTLCLSPRCTHSPQTPSRHTHPQRWNEKLQVLAALIKHVLSFNSPGSMLGWFLHPRDEMLNDPKWKQPWQQWSGLEIRNKN